MSDGETAGANEGPPVRQRDTSAAVASTSGSRANPRRRRWGWAITLGIGSLAVALRVWHLMALGFNSDEAVYAGQAASIAGDTTLLPYFPIFRAHPLLFQTMLSVPYQWGVSPLVGRLLSVALGVGTVWLIYLLGSTLYNRKVGAVAALVLALMPYHVVVTRQVILDGPLVFFSTLSLLLLAKFGQTQKMAWFYASFGAMGLTVLTKETGIVLFGSIYVFVALVGLVRIRHLFMASLVFVIVVLPYPLSIMFSGRSTTGEQFLAWQLFRRANHVWSFYLTEVPAAMGILVVIAAIGAVVYARKRWTWRETLLTSWVLVPLMFFQLWPVKGFQYLLPLATPIAVLAARGLTQLATSEGRPSWTQGRRSWLAWTATVVVAVSLLLASAVRVQPNANTTEFLAGSGGVPGGKQAGEWVGANVPVGAEILALGPSMANIIQFYGNRKVFGLSVSPNPLHRNPVYEPVHNPDLRIRSNDLQYIIWDSFSASRSSFFSDRLLRYAERYHGRIVHTETVEVRSDAGEIVEKPIIVIYEVRP